ncbi:MAG: phenylalanine--tRNA ligase subunit beta [Desulfovibrionaceae bacterium]
MLVSLAWLREFVPYDGGVQTLADKLTMLGLEVEEIRHPFAGVAGVVVGHVLTCARHPQADKLSLCTVDAGAEAVFHVVCGAPNVAAGQKVAFAPVGTTLPGGLTLKKAKIRGEESQGMICAEDELALGDSHAGIMVLDPALTPGTPLIQALGLDEVVLDVSITPNRADCLSVLGIAREVGLAFNLPVTLPTFSLKEEGPDAAGMMRIEIPEPEYCAVYQGRVIEGVTVAPSPAWLRYRLTAVGQRPISNIVDVTNYVLFGLGQPLHSFDMDLLEGGVIRVARASAGQKFSTLDGQERTLTADDLLIWDGAKPVGLAGVMGGLNSEVHEGTSRVFLESAVFRPGTIRKTARRLALPSEASYRFERGVDQLNSRFAMDYAAGLIAELGNGALRPGMAVAEPRPWTQPVVRFRPSRAAKLIGVALDDAFCRSTIEGMGCAVDGADATDWQVRVPSNRLDLEREVDLIEEVARVYGMDRVPATLPQVKQTLDGIGGRESEYEFWMRLKYWARGVGLREAVNYSFVGQADLDGLGLPKDGRIPVKNPLSEDQDVLRTALAPGLLNNVRLNMSQGNVRARLFELAHIFEADPTSDTTAREPGRLGLLVYGGRAADAWPATIPAQAEDADYLDLKGIVEHLLGSLGLPAGGYALAGEHTYLEPCVAVSVDGKPLGLLGRVKADIADRYHARKEVWLAELDTDLLADLHAARDVHFASLPKFPPVRRDITLAAPKTLPLGDVLDHVHGLKLPLLESVVLVDVFEPEGSDDRNLTLRLTFRHADKTLKDKEVDKLREKVASSLVQSLSVTI